MRRLLLRPEIRVLTLTGPPGVGKTRLGDRASHRHPGGRAVQGLNSRVRIAMWAAEQGLKD